MRRRSRSSNPQTPNMKNWCLMECFKSPTPIGTKLVPAKVQVEDLLSSNSCHWFSLMCVFQFHRQFFCEKTVFWKTVRALLGLYTTSGSSSGKTYFFKQFFCFDLRSWYCLFLKALHVRHLEKYFAVCLPAVCQVWELLRQNVCKNCCMSDVCEFWLQLSRLSHFIYLDFSTLQPHLLQNFLSDTALNRSNPYFCTGNLSLS